jgi:hypothetical protein
MLRSFRHRRAFREETIPQALSRVVPDLSSVALDGGADGMCRTAPCGGDGGHERARDQYVSSKLEVTFDRA